jgi:shikimate dehydrogenase
MPLKEEAMRLAENLSDAAKLTGAVNTLSLTESGWFGLNTDVFGIVQALRSANLPALQQILLIGSGATATSAVVAIKELAPNATVEVFARNAESRGQLVNFARGLGLNAKSISKLKKSAQSSDLVISTLPSGALDEASSKLHGFTGFAPSGAVLDVAYSPWPSLFATHWLSSNKPTISGLEMLTWQAIAQLRVFTSGDELQPLSNEVAVLQAVKHALEG